MVEHKDVKANTFLYVWEDGFGGVVGGEAAGCVYLGQVFLKNQNGAPENLENLYRLSHVEISQFPNSKTQWQGEHC